jgi:hypothetical protein
LAVLSLGLRHALFTLAIPTFLVGMSHYGKFDVY